MIYVLNIVIIGLVALIAYWWANQGLFSALLHLLCVIVAGAVALGVWEKLVVGLILHGVWFDYYAWGIVLVGVFAVTLLVLRIATDKLVPANVDMPQWANMVFGFPVGAAAGIVTMGITFLGCGHMQSHQEIMGYRGYGPEQRGTITQYGDRLWLPVTHLTTEFYSWLSVTSMLAPQPMHHYQPRLHWQASLMRASYDDGKGQITMPPKGAEVKGYRFEGAPGPVEVDVHFTAKALDFGEQLTLGAAQVRLISRASRLTKAQVAHPVRWTTNGRTHEFDNFTHYITSVPGQEAADVTIVFNVPGGFDPRFIQLKGTRFVLPQPPDSLSGLANFSSASNSPAPVPAGGVALGPDVIRVSNSIRPIRVSKNRLPGGMEILENEFVSGHGEFAGRGGTIISRPLLMRGVYEPEGTKIVMLDVSRSSPANIYSDAVQDQVTPDSRLRLVDSQGNEYSPMGYLYDHGDGTYELKLAPGDFMRRLDDLPYLPTAGTQQLDLYFRVTAGATVVAFMYGDYTVGTCGLEIPAG